MSQKNKSKVKKKFLNVLYITPVVTGVIFSVFANGIFSPQNSTSLVAAKVDTPTPDPTAEITTSIQLKSPLPPDIGTQFAGQVYYDLMEEHQSDGWLAREYFSQWFNVENPPPKSYTPYLTPKISNDGKGTLEVDVQIKPYLNNNVLINDYSPIKTFVIDGFQKYTAATDVIALPKDNDAIKTLYEETKPSEINQTNIDSFIEIINKPNAYEPAPKITYNFIPDDAKGVCVVELSLDSYIQQNGSEFIYMNGNKPFSVTLSGLKTQLPTNFPRDNSIIDGTDLHTIPAKISIKDVRKIIFKNCENFPSDFFANLEENIFDINIKERDETNELVKVSYKIWGIYGADGQIIDDKNKAIFVDNVTINNLLPDITTRVTIKKSGEPTILAQDIYNLEDSAIVSTYLDITNPVVEDTALGIKNTTVIIKKKDFDNKKGTLTLGVVMNSYYDRGLIIDGTPSSEILLTIDSFKTVSPSLLAPKDGKFDIYPSQVLLKEPTDPADAPLYIKNFITGFESFPDDTIFSFESNVHDINNRDGTIVVSCYANKWYADNKQCSLVDDTRKRQILTIANFKTRSPTVPGVNPDTTKNISEIYVSDVTNADIESYVTFNGTLPEEPGAWEVDFTDTKKYYSMGEIVISINLYVYYDENGLIVDERGPDKKPKNVKLVVRGFKQRLRSKLLIREDSHYKDVLPSSVNADNWQTYIDATTYFPDGTTFSEIECKPTNITGNLLVTVKPDKYFNEKGELISPNLGNEKFSIYLSDMQTTIPTTAIPIAENDSGVDVSIFHILPSEVKNKNAYKYIKITNPDPTATSADYEYNIESANNISGELNIKVTFKKYYDKKGNPSTTNYSQIVSVKGFYSVVPNYLIYANNSSITDIDPRDLVKDPQLFINLYTFPSQVIPNLVVNGSIYKRPIIRIESIDGTDYQLDRGIVEVSYLISDFFDNNGQLKTSPEKFIVTIGGFKSSFSFKSPQYILAVVLIIMAVLMLVITLIIALGILFKKKKYYINESYDRGLITTDGSTIPTVIAADKKNKKMQPTLIPLLKEDKPPKPLKQYKEVKQREVKVKEPKVPVLPGQRKREAKEKLQAFNQKTKNKMKQMFDKTPVNEPFSIDNQWYYKDEQGKYYISLGNDNWIETSKPRKPKVKKEKTPKNNKNKKNKQS